MLVDKAQGRSLPRQELEFENFWSKELISSIISKTLWPQVVLNKTKKDVRSPSKWYSEYQPKLQTSAVQSKAFLPLKFSSKSILSGAA